MLELVVTLEFQDCSFHCEIRLHLVAQLVEAGGAGSLNSAFDIDGFDFASGMRRRWFGSGCFKPEGAGIE